MINDEVRFAYLAGMIDGDGTVRVEKSNHKYQYPRLAITNTDLNMLAWVQDNFGGVICCHQSAATKIGHTNYLSNKPTYRWDTAGKNAAEILKRIAPYLVVKARKAHEIMKDFNHKYDFGEQLVGVA